MARGGASWRVMARGGASVSNQCGSMQIPVDSFRTDSQRFPVPSRERSSPPYRSAYAQGQSFPCHAMSHRVASCHIVGLPCRCISRPFRFAALPCVTARRLALPLRFGPCVALRSFSAASQTNAYPFLIPARPLHAQPFRSCSSRLRSHLFRDFSPLIYSVAARPDANLCLAIQ